MRRLALRSAISAIMVPSRVVPVAVHKARNKRVPRHAAAHTAGQTPQAPDPLVADALIEGHQGPVPVLVQEGAIQGLADRESDEHHQQHRAPHHGRRDEQVAFEKAASRHATSEDHHQREQGNERADPDAELIDRERPPGGIEGCERPALGADHEATHDQSGTPEQAACQKPKALRLAWRPLQAYGRHGEAGQTAEQPDPPMHQGLHQPIGGFRALQDLAAARGTRRVLDGVPRQDQVSQQARHQPQANGLVRMLIQGQAPSPRRLPGWSVMASAVRQ
jgi:hypothetical protein